MSFFLLLTRHLKVLLPNKNITQKILTHSVWGFFIWNSKEPRVAGLF